MVMMMMMMMMMIIIIIIIIILGGDVFLSNRPRAPGRRLRSKGNDSGNDDDDDDDDYDYDGNRWFACGLRSADRCPSPALPRRLTQSDGRER